MSVKIFFCYAHKDEPLLTELKKHLAPLWREGLVDVWYDRDISAGTKWEQQIKEQLNAAQIILLLISPDFMASDYINNVELKRALERDERGEACVIPIILRPVYWQGAPFGKLQALPKDAEPVTNWPNMDRAFFNVTEGVLKAVNELEKKGRQEKREAMVPGSSPFIQATLQDAYRRPWSRQYRGLLVLLLDQSGSMDRRVKIGDKIYSNAQIGTASLNQLILSAINSTPVDPIAGDLKDYFDILVLGYGDHVVPLLSNEHEQPISLREVAKHPKGYQQVRMDRYNFQGSIEQIQENLPWWITNTASSFRSEMALAFQHTYRAIQNWLSEDKRHYQSFPPIVINITASFHNGTGDPVVEANKVHTLATSDGHVLVFNCYLASHQQQRIIFPNSKDIILTSISDPEEREWATQLFYMSSIIPNSMADKVKYILGTSLGDGARGFLYNSDPSTVLNFLKWGTRQTSSI